MFFNKSDSYYYSRPISYRSYNPKLTRPEILKFNDPESTDVLNFLRQQNIEAKDLGGLARGIRFFDIEVGKRHFNHNNYNVSDEYYIHQWKDTNDLANNHATGTHLVFKTFPEFMSKLKQVIDDIRKKYWFNEIYFITFFIGLIWLLKFL